MRARGLDRWSVEDVAEHAGVGRTTVYRRFPSRDDLVHGVLARELQCTIAAVQAAAVGRPRLADRVIESGVVAFAALEHSVVDHLLRSDPATILPFLTTGAGPLIDLARLAIVPTLVDAGLAEAGLPADLLAETLARLGLSFVLTRSSVLPAGDPDALRAAVTALLRPLLATHASQ
jgi:AcrR family transcriptional regulator